ncbi:hypothetical protein KCU98_g4674, partial [Aureobasidium melanogenum]
MDPEALSSDLINAVIHFTRIPHARRALYELLNDPSFVHTDILDLPLEVLERVVSFVDARDLIALRSTCKKLEKAATSSFAHQFIKCRRHVLSTHSLKALVDIAAHPYFGKFVEAVILDTTCSLEYIESAITDKTPDGSLSYSDSYSALNDVLGYLSIHGNLKTLGVTDRNSTSFDVECFASTALGLRKGLSPSTSLKFKVSMTNMNDLGLIWDHKRKTLELSGLTLWSSASPDNMLFGLLNNMTSLSTANITELTLSGCRVMNHDYRKLMELLHACSRTLERVKLSGIVIEDDSTWSQVLQLLARAPDLMEFKMATLSRKVYRPAGYKWRNALIVQIDEWFGNGENVSAELVQLAATVEADELAWESLPNTEKWTYHMTGRKKTLKTLEDKLDETSQVLEEEPPNDSGSSPESTTLTRSFAHWPHLTQQAITTSCERLLIWLKKSVA